MTVFAIIFYFLINIWYSKKGYFEISHKYNIQFNVIKENELPNPHPKIDEIIDLKNEGSKQK